MDETIRNETYARPFEEGGDFHLDMNYYVRQLESDQAAVQREARVQTAAFEQLKDMFNNKLQQIDRLEGAVEELRAEMREHEKLAVDQQMIIDQFTSFKRLVERSGSNYDMLVADLTKIYSGMSGLDRGDSQQGDNGPQYLRDMDPETQLDEAKMMSHNSMP